MIEQEEKRIEQKEDLVRMFEELGLMRWKSYYILTAGAILLLSITFVTALWVMHDQLADIQGGVDEISAFVELLDDKVTPQTEWCPAGSSFDVGAMMPDSQGQNLMVNIVGEETINGTLLCHGVVNTDSKSLDVYISKSGSIQIVE
jgi:hypothetical protein